MQALLKQKKVSWIEEAFRDFNFYCHVLRLPLPRTGCSNSIQLSPIVHLFSHYVQRSVVDNSPPWLLQLARLGWGGVGLGCGWRLKKSSPYNRSYWRCCFPILTASVNVTPVFYSPLPANTRTTLLIHTHHFLLPSFLPSFTTFEAGWSLEFLRNKKPDKPQCHEYPSKIQQLSITPRTNWDVIFRTQKNISHNVQDFHECPLILSQSNHTKIL